MSAGVDDMKKAHNIMKHQHYKTHYFGTLLIILILLSAIIGMYYAFNSAGKAVQMSDSNADTVGFCCCKDSSVFKVPSKKLSSQLMPSDCASVCFEHNAESMGQC